MEENLRLIPSFAGMMANALKSCCGSCARYTVVNATNNQSSLRSLAKSGSADIFFPVLGETSASSVHGFHFVPILFLTGGTLLYVQDKSGKAFASKLLEGVFEVWPLVTIALLLALIAGSIIWLMVSYCNVFKSLNHFTCGINYEDKMGKIRPSIRKVRKPKELQTVIYSLYSKNFRISILLI